MMDRTAATRWSRLAQGGALGALALSAAAVVVGLPGQKTEKPPEKVEIPAPPAGPEQHTAAPAHESDSAGTGTRLARIATPPTKPVVLDNKPPPPNPIPTNDITYHGIVSMGSHSMALIKYNAKQRFVKVGDKVAEEAVEEITPEHVRLGAAHIIALAERSGESVSRLQGVSASLTPNGMSVRGMPTLATKRMSNDAVARAIADKGGFAPPYVPADEQPMWRRLRAQLILTGEHDMQGDLDEIAFKLLADRREEFKANPTMTPEELDAERAYLDKHGRAPREGAKQ